MQSVDIAIVGGGMAGAALALSLAKVGELRIALIEKHSAPPFQPAKAPLDSRVVALNAASLEWLEAMNGLQHLPSAAACDYQAMAVWDGEGTGRVDFDAASLHAKSLGTIVENNALVYALWQALQQCANVQVMTEKTVTRIETGRSPKLTFEEGDVLKAALIVAADGAHSPVREWAGFSIDSQHYEHTALVATLELEKPHGHCAYQRFSHTGPMALLPLPSDAEGSKHYCALVWSQSTHRALELASLDDTEFAQAITRESESVLGHVVAVHHRQMLELTARHATEYYREGTVLVADAAHTIHPLAGQGINLGFADAKALSIEIARAVSRGLPLHEPSIFRRYERARRTHNQAALWAMQSIKSGFELAHPAAVVLRNQGMRMFNRSAWVKKQAIALAQGHL